MSLAKASYMMPWDENALVHQLYTLDSDDIEVYRITAKTDVQTQISKDGSAQGV